MGTGDKYRNFRVAVYCTAHDVVRMNDLKWLEESFNVLKKSIAFSKVYLETFRDNVLVSKDLILRVKDFFQDKGVETSGGIATYVGSGFRFRSLCYSKPDDRERLREVVRLTASVFDEIILDDFFFTSCKCESCINAKGDRDWTEYRLRLMEDVAENIVVKTAKEVNPRVRLIIKYPNWYEHYQSLGYSLDFESRLFDMIYAGTETRDPEYTQQHLQEYQSYLIMRFLENVKPGGNGGGWVDPFARRTLNRYGEQIRLTLFAKPREVTLFCFGALIEHFLTDGAERPTSSVAPIAGRVFEEMDPVLSILGQPYGVKSYKPYDSSGEDFLHNYIGMIGVPVELTPVFPEEGGTVFLTECASFDRGLISKIRKHLSKGGNVIITSGLLKALQKEIARELVEVEFTGRKALAREFWMMHDIYYSDTPILIPQLKYATNDSWEIITCLSRGNGYPLLLVTGYGKSAIYILAIPDNFNDLYSLPVEVLNEIRRVFNDEIRLEGPSRVCIFTYDNGVIIVHSFLPHSSKCSIVVKKSSVRLCEPTLNKELKGFERNGETVFPFLLQPYSFRVFKIG